MNKYILLFALLLVACSGTEEGSGAEIMATPLSTEVYVSTPTIDMGYEATITSLAASAYSSNMTAVYLSGLQVQGTVAAENNMQENIRYTHEADLATAAIAPTAIYLTAEQQKVLNTQIPAQQALEAAWITATHEVPENELKFQQARNTANYGWIEFLLKDAMLLSFCFFACLAGVYLLLRGISLYKLEEVMAKFKLLEEKVVQHTKLNRYRMNDFAETIRKEREELTNQAKMITPIDIAQPLSNDIVVPCTPDQLSEIAENVLVRGKSLAYDHYAGNGSLFKRETYAPMYSFFQGQKFAISTGVKNKGIILTDSETAVREDKLSGLAFLEQWHTQRTLPEGFVFATTPLSGTASPQTVQNDALVHAARVQTDQKGGGMGEFTLWGEPQ